MATPASADEAHARVRDDVDLDQTVWFAGGDVYHRDAPWGPGCPEHRYRCKEHTLQEAADAEKRPCKSCDPEDYRPLVTDGGEERSADTPRVEFVTGADVARVDDDPVLERADIWVSEE